MTVPGTDEVLYGPFCFERPKHDLIDLLLQPMGGAVLMKNMKSGAGGDEPDAKRRRVATSLAVTVELCCDGCGCGCDCDCDSAAGKGTIQLGQCTSACNDIGAAV